MPPSSPSSGELRQGHVGHSRIFRPFRALGIVTDGVPFDVQARGSKYFVTTSVGTAVQIYTCDKLRLVIVGTPTGKPISSIVSHKDFTFAACGRDIVKFRRGREVRRFSRDNRKVDASSGEATLLQIVLLGNKLVALGDDNTITVWDCDTGEVCSSWSMDGGFHAVSILHPSTYINKVLVGGADGSLRLYNIRTSRLVHSFSRLRRSAITFMVSSPVVDVVAVGFLDGTIALHDIRQDGRVMTLSQNDKVTAIAFRSDGSATMASGDSRGDITLWDLEKRRVAAVMRGAHRARVSSIYFFDGQPLMLTSSVDNSVKEWLFDSSDPVGRLLRSREGHGASPTRMRFHDSLGRTLVTGSRDRSVRLVSVIRDAQCVEFSQGKGLEAMSQKHHLSVEELKLPIVTAIATSEVRQSEWDNMLTSHKSEKSARTWSIHRKALGGFNLSTSDGKPVAAVAISSCGNFGFVGSTGGIVDMFNLQSGQHRKSFGTGEGKVHKTSRWGEVFGPMSMLSERHTRAVTGIAPTRDNRHVITTSQDSRVLLWNLNTAELLDSIMLPCGISGVLLSPNSFIAAIHLDDWSVAVVDLETRRIVRTFRGHKGLITDLAFMPGGRWLVTAATDGTVRTWDLPTGLCIDIFKTDSVVSSLAVSPTGEWLATAHADNVGIFLWFVALDAVFPFSCQTYQLRRYSTRSNVAQWTSVSAVGVGEDHAPTVALPTSTDYDDVEEGSDRDAELDQEQPLSKTISEYDSLTRLSSVPKSRLQTLLHLDTIKKRNIPTERVSVPEPAPFFLPTIAGLEPKLAPALPPASEDTLKVVPHAMTSQSFELKGKGNLTRLLRSGAERGNYSDVLDEMGNWTPSAIDFHVRALAGSSDSGSEATSTVLLLLRAIMWCLDSKSNFEFAEVLLSLTLKVHGPLLSESTAGVEAIESILIRHHSQWEDLDRLLAYSNCLASFTRQAR